MLRIRCGPSAPSAINHFALRIDTALFQQHGQLYAASIPRRIASPCRAWTSACIGFGENKGALLPPHSTKAAREIMGYRNKRVEREHQRPLDQTVDHQPVTLRIDVGDAGMDDGEMQTVGGGGSFQQMVWGAGDGGARLEFRIGQSAHHVVGEFRGCLIRRTYHRPPQAPMGARQVVPPQRSWRWRQCLRPTCRRPRRFCPAGRACAAGRCPRFVQTSRHHWADRCAFPSRSPSLRRQGKLHTPAAPSSVVYVIGAVQPTRPGCGQFGLKAS